MRSLALPFVTAALALTLAACGDGNEGTPSVETAIHAGENASHDQAGSSEKRHKARLEEICNESLRAVISPCEAVNLVLTKAGSPQAACKLFVTKRFVAQSYGSTRNCLASRVRGGVAQRAYVKLKNRSGRSARAVALPSGGPNDGEHVSVELVEDKGDGTVWRVDGLTADVPVGP
jgi:hypothetical protein